MLVAVLLLNTGCKSTERTVFGENAPAVATKADTLVTAHSPSDHLTHHQRLRIQTTIIRSVRY